MGPGFQVFYALDDILLLERADAVAVWRDPKQGFGLSTFSNTVAAWSSTRGASRQRPFLGVFNVADQCEKALGAEQVEPQLHLNIDALENKRVGEYCSRSCRARRAKKAG